jgi:hypothetical protein
MKSLVSSEGEYYLIRINKRLIKNTCLGIVLIVFSVLTFAIFHSYRYERFKDGHKYMRYDKWLDKYQKYDIPTKEWKDIVK